MQTKKHVARPMDFSRKNRVSFYDFHRLTLGLHEPGGSLLGFAPIDLRPDVYASWLGMLRRSMAPPRCIEESSSAFKIDD